MPALLSLLTVLAPLLEQAVKAIAAQIQNKQGPSTAEVVAALRAAHAALGEAVASLEVDLKADDTAVDKEIKEGTVES